MTSQVTAKLNFTKKCLLSIAGLAAFTGPLAIGLALAPQELAQAQAPAPAANTTTRHYQKTEWNFALDIPKGWNRFAPVPSNSPSEVMRFGSGEDGTQILIIFRNFVDSRKGVSGLFLDGTLLYTLGFGTNSKPETELALQDRIASSFTFDPTT